MATGRLVETDADSSMSQVADAASYDVPHKIADPWRMQGHRQILQNVTRKAHWQAIATAQGHIVAGKKKGIAEVAVRHPCSNEVRDS